MGPGSDRYEIISGLDEFASLARDWDALGERSSHYRYSLSHAWCQATWENVEQHRGSRLHCLTLRDAGRLVLVWPFLIQHHALATRARPLGNAYGEYSDVLVEDGPEAERRRTEAWRRLRRDGGSDLIAFDCVRADSPLQRILAAEPTAIALAVKPTFGVSWAGVPNWDSYHSALKKHARKDIERRRKRLEQSGTLEFAALEEGEAAAPVIDWIVRHKLAQLARSERRGPWLETGEYGSLLKSAARRGGPLGSVAVFTLRLDQALIAAAMTRVDRFRVELLNTVYDPAYSEHGPGQILTEAALHWAYSRGLDFDFRIDDAAYKRFWSNRTGKAVNYIFVNTRRGMVYLRGERIVEGAKTAMKGLLPPSLHARLKAMLGRPA